MLKTAIFIRDDDGLMEAIGYLHKKTELLYVIFKDHNFNKLIREFCIKSDIECLHHNEFTNRIERLQTEKIDIIFSYYYQKRFENKILNYPEYGCINFHPAPLPKYRGIGNYSKCIIDGLDYWGVSAHIMDNKFDNGELIEVIEFAIDSERETYISLEEKTREYMFKLFCKIVKLALENSITKYTYDEESEISYLSRKIINSMKIISDQDSNKLIDRKIRAFWCPPFNGASVVIGDKQYTLIDEDILKEISKLYKNRR